MLFAITYRCISDNTQKFTDIFFGLMSVLSFVNVLEIFPSNDIAVFVKKSDIRKH